MPEITPTVVAPRTVVPLRPIANGAPLAAGEANPGCGCIVEKLKLSQAARDRIATELAAEFAALNWYNQPEDKRKVLDALAAIESDVAAKAIAADYGRTSWNNNPEAKRSLLAAMVATRSEQVVDALNADYKGLSWYNNPTAKAEVLAAIKKLATLREAVIAP